MHYFMRELGDCHLLVADLISQLVFVGIIGEVIVALIILHVG